VSSGRPFEGAQIRIVGTSEELSPDGVVGEVQVTGPSLMSGYLDRDPSEGFAGDWVRTGDLGFLWDGELYVTGRSKDVLIVMGHNYYPEDFEWAAGRVSRVRPGRTVAFTMQERERIVLLVEPTDTADREGLAEDVSGTVAAAVGTTALHVQVVPPGTIEKTTSGKLRRQAARERYEAGEFPSLN
jgi:fatty-acyl-CoA synthase